MSIKKNTAPSLSDFVDQGPVMKRIMQVMGARNTTELAQITGKTYQSIYNYEENKRGIGWELIFKALGATDKGLDWLIFGKEEESKVVATLPGPGLNAKDVVEWVESKGELSRDYDSGVKLAVAEKFPDFLEWQKKRAAGGGVGTVQGSQDRKVANGGGNGG